MLKGHSQKNSEKKSCPAYFTGTMATYFALHVALVHVCVCVHSVVWCV